MLQNNSQPPQSTDLHVRFQVILPRIQLHAQVCFRHLRPGPRRDDAIAETIGLAWAWYVRLVHQGKDPHQFSSALATFAVRAVKSGRRVCGQEKSKDVLSPFAQQKHGFTVEYLPASTVHPHEQIYSTVGGQHLMDTYEERLHDNTVTPPDEAAAFRIDWPAWLLTRTERDRRLIDQMALNERTQVLARRFGISPSRVSQLRREFHDDWLSFLGEFPAAGPADASA
jgi:hypothetical protein